ncbi:MAG: hypothetical protein DMF90_26445 [Acidobacteria bacterium]|nr:MAG: hypothetical protein DMF90_26445 [Acidobacteriota bacterium]
MHIVHELGILFEYFPEKPVPTRASSTWIKGDWCDLGDEVLGFALTELPVVQIDHAVRDAQEPRRQVPIVAGNSELLDARREPDERFTAGMGFTTGSPLQMESAFIVC